MKVSYLLTGIMGVQLVSAHAYVYALWVNGKDMGRGDGQAGPGYIRAASGNNPVQDVMSKSMTCNTPGTPAPRYIDVKGGDKITVEWAHENRGGKDQVIAESHKGPVQVYLAPAGTDGNGDVWVKIALEGYDAAKNTWATDVLRANKGKHHFIMPPLVPGNYLIRPEITALHGGGAQLYMACVQVRVTGNGNTVLPSGIAIPGAYKTEGLVYNLYAKPLAQYTPPGGPVQEIKY